MPPTLYLGHGASGTAASMRPFVDGLATRGIAAVAVDLPRRKAEDAVSAWRAAVPDRPIGQPVAAPGSGAPSTPGAPPIPGTPSTPGAPSSVAVGGHSYGGRVASLAAADPGTDYAALVLFSYPLHPPGSPERTAARVAHWPRITCPVLLLSGESDPFARIELLRAAVPLLGQAELVTYPRLGHTLRPVLDDVLDRVATFLGTLA
jgi:uncharacterized protein